MTQQVITQSLYNDDFLLWTEDTAKKLRARDFEHLDIDNLVEEVESLGRSEKHEVRQRLQQLLEHILKRYYINIPECDRGWEVSIINQRNELSELLEQSPSLKQHFLDVFDKAWKTALKVVRTEYSATKFPDTWEFSRDIDSLLNTDFWEISSNGSN